MNADEKLAAREAEREARWAAEFARTMKLFVGPGQFGEVRVIQKSGGTSGFFFRFDEIDAAAELAATFDSSAKGIYIVMNEINSATLDGRDTLTILFGGLTKDAHITRRRWILIDFDPASPERGPEDSSTDDEKSAAMELREVVSEYLRGHGFPEAICCDSGNGGHLLFQVDLPNDEASHTLVKSLLAALAARFSTNEVAVDISVHNAARITKLYGSTARKGQDRPDRPHRVSMIQSVPDCDDAILTAQTITAVLSELSGTGGGSLFDQPHNETNGHSGNLSGITLTQPKLILPETFPVGGRHEQLVRLAGAVRSFGANETELGEILRVFNRTRCGNAKPADELAKIAHDFAVKDCNLTMRALIECQSDEQLNSAQRQQSLKLALTQGLKRLSEGRELGEVTNYINTAIGTLTADTAPQEFKTYSMAELDAAEFPMNYLVEGVLVANQPCVIAAGKKSLKTNIACDLTLSLASGSQFLGKFWTPKAVRVAIMTGESGDATTQETMRRIARSKPWINLADYSNAICSFDLPRLGQPQTRRELERFITDNGLKVLIIDPAYLCLELGDDAGNLFTVGKKLKELTDIGHETGCTIIIIHHNKKSVNDPFAIPELESIAWSGFQEWARQWLLIGRRELYDPERAGSHRLWLNVGGSAGHSGCWAVDIEEGSQRDEGGRRWEVGVQGASSAIAETIDQRETAKASRLDAKAERQVAADVEKLLKQYRRKTEGDTAKFYREAAGLSGGRANPANAKLLADGRIEAVTITKNGRPYEGFRLVQESTGTSGTERDSTGTNPACPAGEHRGGLTPLRGSPCPAHRDIENSLNEVASESVSLLHEQAAELFPVGAA